MLFNKNLLFIFIIGSLLHLLRQVSYLSSGILAIFLFVLPVVVFWLVLVRYAQHYFHKPNAKNMPFWFFSYYIDDYIWIQILVVLMLSFISFPALLFFFLTFFIYCVILFDVMWYFNYLWKWLSEAYFYIYCCFLTIISLLGFFQLIFVSIWYIEIPHFMDIGPAQALYPIVDSAFKFPPNALMHDVFNYIANTPFECVNSYSLANDSRRYYYTILNLTDHSAIYKPGIINWGRAIEELGPVSLDLTKEQAVLHWIIVSDLLSVIDQVHMTKLNNAGVLLSDLANIYDLHIHHPSFLGIKEKTIGDHFLYAYGDQEIRKACGRPLLGAEGSLYQLVLLERLESDVSLVSSDEIILGGLGYTLPGPVSDFKLPPYIKSYIF